MDYIKEYKKFVNSYNFTDALRVTIGVTLPSIILGYFGHLPIGLMASLGALTVSTADVPGPIQRRITGMTATLVLNFMIALVIGFSNTQPVLLGILIAILCFSLSIIGIYGNRVNAIGFAGLMVMVLTMDHHDTGWRIFLNSLYLVAGGAWYMLLSLLLFRMRPYLITQQALGDCIVSIGDYLKTRSWFYNENVDYEKTYKSLMQIQEEIHEKQDRLREMIFKSRSVVKQSTIQGRRLLVIFIESIDLFEKATGTVYNYESMHRRFDGTDILPRFQDMIVKMSEELHEIGLAIQAGRRSKLSKDMNEELKLLKRDFEVFIEQNRSPENIAPLISMRKVMQALEDMTIRIYTLHHYTGSNKRKLKAYKLSENYDPFVPSTPIELDLLKENFSLQSNTFRHAIRVSIATVAGYIVALALRLEYSYWVLLTIIVILKPSYSLTKQRNYHRLWGTLIGAALGVAFLFIIPNEKGRLVAMILLILATNSFIRTNYFVGVIFMTSYVLIFFYLLSNNSFVTVLENRVLDTIVGSIIAFLATSILVPSWEKLQIKNYMQEAIDKATAYFNTVAQSFITGNINDLNYRLNRKNAFVAQSNLSAGFNRMMNEPKNKQGDIKKLHQFAVLIYTLNSHIVTLADFAQKFSGKYHTDDFSQVAEYIAVELNEAKNNIAAEKFSTLQKKDSLNELKSEMDELVDRRRLELQQGLIDTETKTTLIEYKPIVDQFLFISRIAGDIKKLSLAF